MPDNLPFADLCLRVEAHLANDYGIRIVTRDIPDPLTGDLDGVEIHLDYALSSEERLFLLAHLFGHTVQWNVDPRAYAIGQLQVPPVPVDLLSEIMEYERQAAALSLGMLHQIGITSLDQWLSDYAACDAAYLRHFYTTGEKKEFRSFRREGAPLIQPLPVPPFTPARQTFRTDGLVI